MQIEGLNRQTWRPKLDWASSPRTNSKTYPCQNCRPNCPKAWSTEWDKPHRVEVMERYCNQGEMASHLGELSAMNPGPVAPTVRNTPKQVQRRLDSNKVDQLVADYLAGAKVRDLADLFQISRNTVLEHVSRAGVRKHYPALIPEQVDEAAQLYRSGQSLVSVGEHFGVNVSTVRTALLKVGVEMRDCHGREHE